MVRSRSAPLGASRHPHPASTCQLYLVTFNMSPSTCQPPPPLTLTPTLAPGTELIASPPAAASAVSELSGREPSASSPSSSFDVEVVLAEPLMPGSAATVGIFASSSFAVTFSLPCFTFRDLFTTPRPSTTLHGFP